MLNRLNTVCINILVDAAYAHRYLLYVYPISHGVVWCAQSLHIIGLRENHPT